MGWAKSAGTGRRIVTYQAPVPPAMRLRDGVPGVGIGSLAWPPGHARGEAQQADQGQGIESARPAETSGADRPKRDRRALPVYDVATGEDLETPVNLDNTLLQAMFPDLQIALGQVPPPPPRATPEQLEAYWQSVLEDLARDLGGRERSAGQAPLAGQGNLALDVATGARKEGRFLYTDGAVGRQVADTFEKIMAYGGLLASPCQRPPQFIEGVRILVVPEGEMGTGDCAGKMSTRLAELFDKDGSQAGQFRLGIRLGEDTIAVGKGTLKQMGWRDPDYDLILPDSSFKGNVPAFGEHTLDIHLGFVAWSQERRTKLSYQALQWFDPDLVEQCIFPRADTQIPILLEAMKSSEGACRFLKIDREERQAEVYETERGELEAEDTREPAVLEQVLTADVSGELIDHPYVQSGLNRRLRQAWHDLAVGGGVKVPSFMGLPDSFRGAVDWLPEGVIVCPDLPAGEVLATRYPIRTRHDVQIWQNVTSWKELQKLGFQAGGEVEEGRFLSFFLYARKHKGVVFMSHATAKRVGGDFDGDNFQIMPITPHKPLEEIAHPNRDWSDLAPLVDQVRREGWGSLGTTPKVKRRLATHVAPERPQDVTATNRRWLASAAIQQGGHRGRFLVNLGHHLDAQTLAPEKKGELANALGAVAGDPGRSLDEAVEIAEAHGFDSHGWVARRESDLFGLAQRYNREQAARQALKNVDSYLGQIVYTISRVNASERYTPEEREQTISRLAEELQAEVDKFKYDTAANMDYVDEVRKKVGRELVWLDVHKDPDVFTRETRLSPSKDAVSHLWNHTTRQFRAWERAPQPPKHFKDMLSTEFTPEQYAEARKRVVTYNRTIARAMQTDDEKALVSAIQELEGWSETYTDPQERRVMAQAVWHAAHETERPGATASAAFHAFRPELLAQLKTPRPRPMREIVILGAQHENNLGNRVVDYDQSRTTRLRILLEDYTDTYGRTERRMAAYELDDAGAPAGRIGYLPKDAPRREGSYLARLSRPEGKRRIEGTLAPLQEHGER
jgi:hypothetical protein